MIKYFYKIAHTTKLTLEEKYRKFVFLFHQGIHGSYVYNVTVHNRACTLISILLARFYQLRLLEKGVLNIRMLRS